MAGAALIYSLALLAAIIFAGAAWHKARDFRRFVGVVSAYEITPVEIAPAVAALLLAAEAIAVVLLVVTPWLGAAGLVLAGAIFVLYASALLFNFMRGKREIDCGCSWGGSDAKAHGITPWHVLRSAALGCVTLSGGAIWATGEIVGLSLGGVVVAIAVSAAAAMAYAACETLIANSVSFDRVG